MRKSFVRKSDSITVSAGVYNDTRGVGTCTQNRTCLYIETEKLYKINPSNAETKV